jgi:8-oxo-dGTP pyrophosphatase MutT (NUDIX family)
MSHAQPLTERLDRLRERLASHRPWTEPDPDALALRWAAVAVILAPAPDAVLLIRRAERVGDPWSGHMALPGGRQEPSDGDLIATAIRETAEEVGLVLSRDHLLGSLDDVAPRTPVLPPIAIRPHVFLVRRRPPLTLNPEVAGARWIDLDRLLEPGTHHPVRIEVGGESRDVAAYELDDAIVWGMTERVLSALLAQVDRA